MGLMVLQLKNKAVSEATSLTQKGPPFSLLKHHTFSTNLNLSCPAVLISEGWCFLLACLQHPPACTEKASGVSYKALGTLLSHGYIKKNVTYQETQLSPTLVELSVNLAHRSHPPPPPPYHTCSPPVLATSLKDPD